MKGQKVLLLALLGFLQFIIGCSASQIKIVDFEGNTALQPSGVSVSVQNVATHKALPRLRQLVELFADPEQEDGSSTDTDDTTADVTSSASGSDVGAPPEDDETKVFSLDNILDRYRGSVPLDNILDDIEASELKLGALTRVDESVDADSDNDDNASVEMGVEDTLNKPDELLAYVNVMSAIHDKVESSYEGIASLNSTLEHHLEGILNFDITLAQVQDEVAEAQLWVETKEEIAGTTENVENSLTDLDTTMTELKNSLTNLREIIATRATSLAAAGKYVKLLAKQILADQQSGECYAPDVSEEYTLSNSLTHTQAADYCTNEMSSSRLCYRSEICPDGPLTEPFGGMRTADVWVPTNDCENCWLSLGNNDPENKLCRLHQEIPGDYGYPQWDEGEYDFKGTFYCCPKGQGSTTTNEVAEPSSTQMKSEGEGDGDGDGDGGVFDDPATAENDDSSNGNEASDDDGSDDVSFAQTQSTGATLSLNALLDALNQKE